MSNRTKYELFFVIIYFFFIYYSEAESSEATMFSPEEQLKEILGFDKLPSSPGALKPGFYFDHKNYPDINKLNFSQESISMIDQNTVMQHSVLENENTSLFLYFLVNNQSGKMAREKFITFAASITSMMVTSYTAGPSGIGEASIILGGASDKSTNMIHFIRNNIVVSITVKEGAFNALALARQIDKAIQDQEDLDNKSLKAVSPIIKAIRLPDKITINGEFTIVIEVDSQNDPENLIYIFQYDEEVLNLETQIKGKAQYTAVGEGKTVIRYAVVNTKTLLSTTGSTAIIISK